MFAYLLGLGSNVAQPRSWLERAVARVRLLSEVHEVRASSVWSSPPIGGPDGQSEFANAALQIDSTLAPLELLDALRLIEDDLGRVRSVRWGARTIDLDVILCGRQLLSSDRLILPHPRWSTRQFVLQPAAELVPDWVDPVSLRTVIELRDRWLVRPAVFTWAGFDDRQIVTWIDEIRRRRYRSEMEPLGEEAVALGTSGELHRTWPDDREPHAVFVPPEWYPLIPSGGLPAVWQSAPRVPLGSTPLDEIVAAVLASDPASVRRQS